MRMLQGWENEKVMATWNPSKGFSYEKVEREASQKNVLSEDSI